MAFRLEVGIDCRDPERLASFWAAALGRQIGEPWDGGRYLRLPPAGDGGPVIYFQRVPEPKVAKNRLHLDLWTDDSSVQLQLLEELGATRLGAVQTGERGNRWQVMADPEGNEFCVCEESLSEH